jgi:DNA-directed RNA polymerase specialized sigma24 family protein
MSVGQFGPVHHTSEGGPPASLHGPLGERVIMTRPDQAETSARRLEFISTIWGDVLKAHAGPGQEPARARQALVLRYNKGIRAYVGALVRDDHAADELAQEVVVRLLRGQFASASPERGSFRRMLMVAARNLARTWWTRSKRRAGAPLEVDIAAPADTAADEEADAAWRQTLLDMAWRALERHERQNEGSFGYTLLRLRADHPDDESDALAGRLSAKLGRPVRADAVRQQLRRARVRFAQLLLEEVARTLDEPTPERVEEELRESGLWPYVDGLLPDDWQEALGT